ncbi:MAG: magnesium/cobalt transporter CorA [Candidatus Dactylopiibacterium sp.]|nr:magnesium/cobalt transporter CorA [Candidatus Dactylopiibacterium sp.]
MHKASDRKPARRKRTYAPKIGQAPGSIIHVGEVKVDRTHFSLFDYDESRLEEVSFDTLEQSRQYKRHQRWIWLNVHGVHEPAVMEEIGRRFHIHPLVLEDIANTQQRPKLDDYDAYSFVVLRNFRFSESDLDVSSEQVSIVVGKDFVLSFQERPSGLFDPIRNRLRKNNPALRGGGPEVLLHALIDSVVDKYFVVVEALASAADELEDSLVSGRRSHSIEEINHLKREALEIRREVWPLREMLGSLLRTPGALERPESTLYFRDVYDHTVHVIDQLDALREMIAGLMDIHLSSVSNRMNAEVRMLTVVTTLFAPATLVTGFFGMNFRYIPLLDEHAGWWLTLLIIALAGVALMVALFWRRSWLRRNL